MNRRPSLAEYVDQQVSIELDDDDVQPQTSRQRDTSRQPAQHCNPPPPPAPAVTAPAAATVTAAPTTAAAVSREETHTGYVATSAGGSGVTSVRVRDVGRRQQLNDASPYFCSRVSVGAGSTVRQVVADPQQTVTRITTLSRGSARRHDVHQQTA